MKPEAFRSHALRLLPGDDFRRALQQYITEQGIAAAVLIAAVGSFSETRLRFAGQDDAALISGPVEIVSVTGTLGQQKMHVHLSVSDASGHTLGGHLAEGCTVRTTCEIVLLELLSWTFTRAFDARTGYDELFLHRLPD